jgi:hypothetical protein
MCAVLNPCAAEVRSSRVRDETRKQSHCLLAPPEGNFAQEAQIAEAAKTSKPIVKETKPPGVRPSITAFATRPKPVEATIASFPTRKVATDTRMC